MIPDWQPCTEENYPADDEICIVKARSDGGVIHTTFPGGTLGWGWGVHIKNNSQCFKFKKNKHNGRKTKEN